MTQRYFHFSKAMSFTILNISNKMIILINYKATNGLLLTKKKVIIIQQQKIDRVFKKKK